MKVFVVHRGASRRSAMEALRQVESSEKIKLQSIFLDCSGDLVWKQAAKREMYEAEVVLVFNPEACGQSEHARWELEVASGLGKQVIEYSETSPIEDLCVQLRAAYDFDHEFEKHFEGIEGDPKTAFDQYSIMVNTSEELVRRRQLTNGFFITIIGGLLAAAGFVLSEALVPEQYLIVFLLPTFVGLLLCRSWARLIAGYGKLNSAKFKVINRIEEELPVGMFSAEWIALGKGLRKDKYQSFTESEGRVPKYFSFMFFALGVVICWQSWDSIVAVLCYFYSVITTLVSSQ